MFEEQEGNIVEVAAAAVVFVNQHFRYAAILMWEGFVDGLCIPFANSNHDIVWIL